MPDVVDLAQERDALIRDSLIQAHRSKAGTGTVIPSGPKACVSCGDEIPPQRLEIMPETNLCGECANFKAGKK